MPSIKNAILKDYSYYGTGGPCEVLYLPESIEELQLAVIEIQKNKMPFFLLGKGTNSLVMDEPWAGAVISFSKLRNHKLQGNILYCEAGVENSEIANLLLANKLDGGGWMFGLPGQLGGTVRMNARCYGGEISQIVTKVTTIGADGKKKIYENSNIFRGYKDTIFMTNNEIVAAAEMRFSPGDPTKIKSLMDSCYNDRDSKGQYQFPSCGCVFKNDYSVGVPSGKLLEAAGAKGLKHGGAEVSKYHANFVYNKGATAREILEISIKMRELVYKKFGAWMEYEMEVLGEIPEDLVKEITKKLPNSLNEAALKPVRDAFKN